MSIERQGFGPEKNREKTEQEIKEELVRTLEFSKEKKKLLEKINKDKKLAYLKAFIVRWLIPVATAEHIVAWEHLDNDEIRDIFEKMDEIEEIQNIDDILPKRLRTSKEEYLKALEDTVFRQDILKKLDDSLDYLYHSTHKSPFWIMNFFSGLIHSLDHSKKSVMKIQGNTIDIKRSLISTL